MGCPPPSDRDGDGITDSNDRCPDARGAFPGCPPPSDRDGDGLPDSGTAARTHAATAEFSRGARGRLTATATWSWTWTTRARRRLEKQADGCEPFVWRYFFGTQGVKDFAADKPNDTTYCSASLG